MNVKLLLVFCVLSSFVSAQQKLKFTYDTSGNQTLRDKVCATCAKAKLPSEKDSVQTVIDEDAVTPAEALARLEIVAAPNPVTNYLTVDWALGAELVPASVELYAMDNRLLMSFQVRTGQAEQEINFTNCPSGLYIVQVIFINGQRRSFKILKS